MWSINDSPKCFKKNLNRVFLKGNEPVPLTKKLISNYFKYYYDRNILLDVIEIINITRAT